LTGAVLVCPVAAVVGIVGAGDGSGRDHVSPAQVRAPVGQSVGRAVTCDGAGWTFFAGLGRLGRFPPAKLQQWGRFIHQALYLMFCRLWRNNYLYDRKVNDPPRDQRYGT